jgi:hypothetical protein
MSLWYQMVILMLILKSIVLMMITVYLVSAKNNSYTNRLRDVPSLLEMCVIDNIGCCIS